MVFRTLSVLDGGTVPEEVLGRLRADYRASANRNLLLMAELLRVVDFLAEHRIPAIPYKGPVLATLVYGDVSLRQFSDLDVIVPEEDVPRVKELLAQRGYRTAHEFTGKDVCLVNDGPRVSLELHWAITSRQHAVRIDSVHLWENLRTVPIGGRPVLAHAPEDLLWILCVHGGHHRWERLSWVCDVAELIRRTTLDWDRVVDRGTELGIRRILFLGLLLARDLSGAELPPSIGRTIDAYPALAPLAERVKGWLELQHFVPWEPGDVERYLIKLGDRAGDRLRIAVRQAGLYLALSRRDTEAVRLPRYFKWVLYVLRPIRLVWSYGLAPVRRFVEGIFGA
jgi:hypothetical protein